MLIEGLKSKTITCNDSIITVILQSLHGKKMCNRDILVVTSKAVSITEGRLKQINDTKEFDEIVKNESDILIGNEKVQLTIKNNILTPWAGIDQSNVPENMVVLWPKDPHKTAKTIWLELKKKYKLSKFGVIISDSFCSPLRKGVTAVTLGYAGFEGIKSYVGKKDIYGKPMKFSSQNIADMLATSAHLVMGEGSERTPFALIKSAPVKFTDSPIRRNSLTISEKECLYHPLYKSLKYDRSQIGS